MHSRVKLRRLVSCAQPVRPAFRTQPSRERNFISSAGSPPSRREPHADVSRQVFPEISWCGDVPCSPAARLEAREGAQPTATPLATFRGAGGRSASFGHAERGKTRNTPKGPSSKQPTAGQHGPGTVRRKNNYDGTQSYASVSSSNTGQHFCFWQHCACPSTRLARVPREAGFRSGHEKGLNLRAGRRQQRETRRGLSRPPGFLHVLGTLANCLPSPGSC